MTKALVTDELWEVIEPLLPEEPPKPNGGRPRIDDRAVLTGILFVLKSGIPLGNAAPGDGLRLWDDLLAASEGMARSGCVGRAAPHLVGSAGQGRRDRLGEGIFGRS
jgi:hypothetical protein